MEKIAYSQNTIKDMVSLISTKYKRMFSQKLLQNIDIYNFWCTHQLTQRAQKDMLTLLSANTKGTERYINVI